MAKPFVDVQYPVGGLNRRHGFQAQPPFTTANALNERPFDVLEGRGRGGSRPGLRRVFADGNGDPLGVPGNRPIRMLANVNIAATDGYKFWTDSFVGDELDAAWSNAPSYQVGLIPNIEGGYARAGPDELNERGVVRTRLDDIDVTKPYTFSMAIVPDFVRGHQTGVYRFYARLNNASPAGRTDSLIGTLRFETHPQGVKFIGSLSEYIGTNEVPGPSGSGLMQEGPSFGWFTMTINDNVATIAWRGVRVTDPIQLGTPAGSRFGFSMTPTIETDTQTVPETLVNEFRVEYTSDIVLSENTRTILVVSSAGRMYQEQRLGVLERVFPNTDLAGDRSMNAVDFLQKLYVADTGPPVAKSSDGTFVSSTWLTSGDYLDWGEVAFDPRRHLLVVTRAVTPVRNGAYKISRVVPGQPDKLEVEDVGGPGTCSFRIEPSPKVYDPAAKTLEHWQVEPNIFDEKGMVPSGCPLISKFLGRIYLAASPSEGLQNWFACRFGEPLDWDFGALGASANEPDTAGAAFAGNTQMGDIGEPMTALFAYRKDYQIHAGVQSLWVQRGDPHMGGLLDNVSTTIGIIGRQAYCLTPEGRLVFLSRDGLYMLERGAVGEPVAMSRDRLPREMIDVQSETHEVILSYDVRFRGIHIYLTQIESGTAVSHWWFDWQTRGYHLVKIRADHEPLVAINHESAVSTEAGVLLGCRDGYLRGYHKDSQSDDGVDFGSFTWIGPIRLSESDYFDGMLEELVGQPALQSGSVSCFAHVGNTAEEARRSEGELVATWSGGLNYTARPKLRGVVLYLRLVGTPGVAWTMESMNLVRRSLGRRRLL